MKPGSMVQFKHNGKLVHGQFVNCNTDMTLNLRTLDFNLMNVVASKVQVVKKKSMKRLYVPKSDTKCVTKRLGRYRRVEVVSTRFNNQRVLGDFGKMLKREEYRHSGVCMFNDNHTEFEFHGLHPTFVMLPGGGNAVARAVQHTGDSIGMPTGPYASLDQQTRIQLNTTDDKASYTAKEVIDEAILRIVRLFIDKP